LFSEKTCHQRHRFIEESNALYPLSVLIVSPKRRANPIPPFSKNFYTALQARGQIGGQE
jgi:hypothetical protein